MTSPAKEDIFRTNSKQILVTRDPVYCHPAVKDGHFVGREPHSYLPFAILVTIINPLLGPISIVFAFMSRKSFSDGDVNYAMKWSNLAFSTGMITIVGSCIMYIAIGFALGGPELRGGHSY